MVVLLLCAGAEPNSGPTTKNEDLNSKIDTWATELKTLHQETIDRLIALANDITARVSAYESSISILEIKVAKLLFDLNDNIANTMKMATDLAAITSAQAKYSATWPTSLAVGSKLVGLCHLPRLPPLMILLWNFNAVMINASML